MLAEIFTLLIRDLLVESGGSLPRAELEEELALELEQTALQEAPRDRVAELVDQVVAYGPLIEVDDVVFDVAVLIEHVAFTHRLTPEERAAGRLAVDADLALISRIAEPDPDAGLHLADMSPLRLVVTHADGAGLGGTHLRTAELAGPPGWLDAFEPGAVLVATVADGILHLRPLTAEEPAPAPDHGAEVGARLRAELLAAVESANEGDGNPVGVDQLQAAAIVGGWFEPGPDQPPFGEVLGGAGLERSGELAAPSDRWEASAAVSRAIPVLARHLDHLDRPETSALQDVLEAFAAWRQDRTSTPPRSALAPLHRMPEAALCLEEELARADPSGQDLVGFLDAFERPGGTVAAVLDTLRALAAELTGRPADAESLLADACAATPEWFPATEALAHLHEVRGRTQEAVNLLQTTRTAEDAELQILRLRARLSNPSAGRNDPCPCGSGRKYKQCHLGQTLLPPEVQVSWLLDKARAHLNRFGPFTVTDHLPARTDLHADAELMAADVALFGHGCLAGFLDARRELLPADEVALCEAWIAGNRPGLYRVVGGDYGDRTSDAIDGETVVLVDIDTDEPFVVQGTALFDESGLADVVWCRLLPDGERWWTSGFARGVTPDEVAVLAAATRPDAEPADLLRALLGQPVNVLVLATDGHPQASAASTWDVGDDGPAVEAVLDREAERSGGGWTVADEHGTLATLRLLPPVDVDRLAGFADLGDLDDLGPEERAQLDGLARFSLVADADSAPRHARALELVPSWLPDATLTSEHLIPLARRRAQLHHEELYEALYFSRDGSDDAGDEDGDPDEDDPDR